MTSSFVKMTICALGLVLVRIAPASLSAQDSLSLTLTFDKATYYWGEGIYAEVLLINNMGRSLRVAPLGIPSRAVEVVDSTGKSVSNWGVWWERTAVRDTVIPPYDTLQTAQLLCAGYGFSKTKEEAKSCFSLGQHRLRAVYCRGLYSDFQEIEILKPTGDEKLAYDLLYEGQKNLTDKRHWNYYIGKLEEMIRLYPTSVYVPEAMKGLLRFHAFKRDTSKIIETANEIIERFPDHRYSEDALSNITARQSEAENTRLLSRIIREKPGTRVARYAQQLLIKLTGGQK